MTPQEQVKNAIETLFMAVKNSGDDYDGLSAAMKMYIRGRYSEYKLQDYETLEALCSLLRDASWACGEVVRTQADNYANEIMKA